ncbi:conserved hypothetical protein [Chryseobacterium sp. 8AT]|nr:conserved hypothetical protein [Chryseobacterium sp. 8AT]
MQSLFVGRSEKVNYYKLITSVFFKTTFIQTIKKEGIQILLENVKRDKFSRGFIKPKRSTRTI